MNFHFNQSNNGILLTCARGAVQTKYFSCMCECVARIYSYMQNDWLAECCTAYIYLQWCKYTPICIWLYIRIYICTRESTLSLVYLSEFCFTLTLNMQPPNRDHNQFLCEDCELKNAWVQQCKIIIGNRGDNQSFDSYSGSANSLFLKGITIGTKKVMMHAHGTKYVIRLA